MLMKRGEWFNYLEMVQQLDAVTGIFSQYKVHLFQHLQRPESDILKITYGSGNYREH